MYSSGDARVDGHRTLRRDRQRAVRRQRQDSLQDPAWVHSSRETPVNKSSSPSNSLTRLTSTSFDLDFGMGGKLVEYMRGPGIQQFADEPGAVTLFKYAHGTDVIFGLLEKNAEQKQAFDDYMAARRVDDMPQWFDIYPVAEKLKNVRNEPGAALMVDVGGGPGQELARFKERHPEILGRFVLQDLPITLNRIEKLPEGIEAMDYDFFTPQPVKGTQTTNVFSQVRKILTEFRISSLLPPRRDAQLVRRQVCEDPGANCRGHGSRVFHSADR